MKKVIVPFFLCISIIATAQKKEERKYAARAQEVDDEIMSNPDPLFASNAIPDSLSKSSGVIIAKKIDLSASFDKKVKSSRDYNTLARNTTQYNLTIREKIKILDKSALNDYSEFSFSKIRKQSNFFKRSAFFFLGIRLIKPNGTVTKINVDEEAVNAPGEDEKEKYKLAIPGLELGDIVDIYARVEQESRSDLSIDPLDIILGGEYPILTYSFNVKVQREFGIIYTVSNGAPELDKTEQGNFIYLKTELHNVAKTTDYPWVIERRELPVIKLNITPGADAYSTQLYVLKQGQVLRELPKGWIDNYYVRRLITLYWPAPSAKLKDFKAYLKQVTNGNDSRVSEDSLIHYIYYYGRYRSLYDNIPADEIEVGKYRNMSSAGFDFLEFLLEAFSSYTIQYDLIYTVPKNSGTIYDVLSPSELYPIVRATGKKEYYLMPPDMFTIVNSFPPAFEGQDAYVFKNVQYLEKGNKSEIQKMPFTRPGFNFMSEDLTVAVNADKPQQLDITRVRTERGNPGYDDQVSFLLFEDYIDLERARFNSEPYTKKILAESGKKGQQLMDEYKQAYVEARKKRIDYVRSELEGTFETKTVTLDSFEVLKMGGRHDQTDFVFQEKISMDGILKKAGQNYILDINSLIADQIQIKPEQRVRPFNIYLPYARTYEYRINLVIPKGFTVQGLENLQKNVSNETGSFVSSASVENDKLLIKATKIYSHNYEPAANWDKMLQFLDAAYNFSQEKVLLKKN